MKIPKILNVIKDCIQIKICALLTKRGISQVIFRFFFGTEINTNAKLMDPRDRPMETYAACWSSNNIIK